MARLAIGGGVVATVLIGLHWLAISPAPSDSLAGFAAASVRKTLLDLPWFPRFDYFARYFDWQPFSWLVIGLGRGDCPGTPALRHRRTGSVAAAACVLPQCVSLLLRRHAGAGQRAGRLCGGRNLGAGSPACQRSRLHVAHLGDLDWVSHPGSPVRESARVRRPSAAAADRGGRARDLSRTSELHRPLRDGPVVPEGQLLHEYLGHGELPGTQRAVHAEGSAASTSLLSCFGTPRR